MRSLLTLTCALTLLATPVAMGDAFVVDSSDPLLLSSEPRLRAIIEAINDRKAIELLLGGGIPLTDDGTSVLYNVIPGGIEQIADRNIAEDFVDQVQVN